MRCFIICGGAYDFMTVIAMPVNCSAFIWEAQIVLLGDLCILGGEAKVQFYHPQNSIVWGAVEILMFFLYWLGNYSLPCLWYPLKSDLVIMSNELPSLPFVCIDHIWDNDTFLALLATHPRFIALFKRTLKKQFLLLSY